MKKILIIALLVSLQGICKANVLTDQIQAAFVGNAKMAIEFTSHGQTQYEFLDNFVEIGKLKGSPVAALDLGLLGTQLPDATIQAVDWSTGAKIHISPLIKNWVTVEPEWQFINTLEIDGRYSYNWTRHHPTLGISIAYPWK